MTHAERRARLAARLADHEADALLVTKPVNVRYLTGLESSNAALLVDQEGGAVLATDSRYATTARRLGVEVIETRQVQAELAKRWKGGPLGFEAHHMTVEEHARLRGPGSEDGRGGLRPAGRLVEDLRLVKDETEIEDLRVACAITDQAFADTVERIRAGMTEREIAQALEMRMVELGAEKPAFDSIVASGPNGGVPHHSPGDRVLAEGDLITCDFGARYRGYHADMTRTVAVGQPASWQRELYDLVRLAQRRGREAVTPGADRKAVDAAARDVIAAAGHGEHFEHGLGHGVGLEIHEDPFLGPGKPGKLENRVPITIEPGVYVPGQGGVRIEDTLVTRDDGPELLTLSTKELLVL